MSERAALMEKLKFAACEGVGRSTFIGYLPTGLQDFVRPALRRLRAGDVVTFDDSAHGKIQVWLEAERIEPVIGHPDGQRVLWQEELYEQLPSRSMPNVSLLRLLWRKYE